MKKMMAITALLLSQVASAYTLGIVELEESNSPSEDHVVYGSDGRMYTISADNSELVEKALEAKDAMLEVEVKLSENALSEDTLELRNEIFDISFTTKELDQKLMTELASLEKDFGQAALLNSYVTDLDYESQASDLFRTQRTDAKTKSQCFNRAHVWSWEMSKRSFDGRSIQMGKIWVFFTKRYIRNYNYKWWFHISPYLNVNGSLRVMDRTFANGPMTEKGWTDMFIASKQACPVVYNYSDYSQNQNSSDCYVMKSSVFYWQPWQLENVEKRNQSQQGWNRYELKKAYRNAIGWFAKVP